MSNNYTLNRRDQLRGFLGCLRLLAHSQQVMLQHRCISLITSPSHNFTLSFLHPLISSPSHGHCFITALSRCLELSLPGEEGGWLFLLRLITGRLLIDRLVPLCSPAVVVKAE